jgi:hypothetical protein
VSSFGPVTTEEPAKVTTGAEFGDSSAMRRIVMVPKGASPLVLAAKMPQSAGWIPWKTT